jgi:putative transcription antitermination factor YqgF
MPHEIVSRVELVRYLKKTLKERKIETIVIGLPYDLYNKDTKQLDKTKKFIKKLEDIFPDKKIAGHDERYTTFEAEQILEKN